MIDEFQADMHQREEESVVAGYVPGTTKVTRRKPFYAAEVVLKGVDLRAMLATFEEPLKQAVPVTAPQQRSNYRARDDIPETELSSPWYDADDFIETDWSSCTTPTLHFLPVAALPRFAYFKRNSATSDSTGTSKFGLERSHNCLLGTEPCKFLSFHQDQARFNHSPSCSTGSDGFGLRSYLGFETSHSFTGA